MKGEIRAPLLIGELIDRVFLRRFERRVKRSSDCADDRDPSSPQNPSSGDYHL
jgi:hypothetical protein